MALAPPIIKLKRGTQSQVLATTLADGEPAVALDTGSVFIYDGSNKVLIGRALKGTSALRPAAGISGRVYFETDTEETFLDDGTAWKPLVGTLPYLQFYEGTNPPKMIDVDPLNMEDAAAFEPGVVQDVVFRIPSSFGHVTGYGISLRYFVNGTVSSHVKLKLDYRPVTPGDSPDGGTSYSLTYQINPMPSDLTVAVVKAFSIPKANIPLSTSWINCRLSRLGTDIGDGYLGEFCLMSITPKTA
jgi:hypothetical protein